MAHSLNTDDIYASLFDDDAFAALPAMLAEAVDGKSSVLQWQHKDGGVEVLASSYYSKDFLEKYAAEFYMYDPWRLSILAMGLTNEVVLGERLVPSQVYEKSLYYNDFIKKNNDDTFYCMTSTFESKHGVGMLGIERGCTDAPFEASDCVYIQEQSKHLHRVLNIRGEVATHRRSGQLADAALDAMGLAVIIALGDGRILKLNSAAETVLRRSDGLVAKAGVLSVTAQRHPKLFEGCLKIATQSSGSASSTVRVQRRNGKGDLLITIAPLVGHCSSAAMILFRDTDVEEQTLATRLRTLYGMTAMEAAVAVDLSKGRTTAEIAEARGVLPSTIKTQLSAAAAKMGCSRQSEIAALVASLPRLNQPRE